MKNILVPIDGSECSLRAVQKAKEVAALSGGKITLLNVYNSADTIRYNVKAAGEIGAEILKSSKKILAAGKALLAGTGIRVTVKSIDGIPAEQILQFANNGNFDLVIIGGHGWSVFNELFLGGIANKIVNGLKIPVMVVK